MKTKIKEIWFKVREICRNENVIMIFPLVTLALLAIPPRPLPFIFLLLWVVVMVANAKDE